MIALGRVLDTLIKSNFEFGSFEFRCLSRLADRAGARRTMLGVEDARIRR